MMHAFKRAAAGAALACSLLLAACSATGGFSGFVSAASANVTAAAQTATNDLLAINQGLAAAAPSVESLVAGAQVAVGYATTLLNAGYIPKASATELSKASAVLSAIANNSPSSVGGAVAALAAVKTNVQMLSTAPASAAAAVATAPIPATSVSAAVPATVVTVPPVIPATPVAPAAAAN